MSLTAKFTRLRGAATALALAGVLGGCEGLLDVKNPSLIQDSDLQDPALVPFLINGVIGEFQSMYTAQALYSGILADELIDGHVYTPHRGFDRRELSPAEEISAGRYAAVHRARGIADSVTVRLESILKAEASRDLNVARAKAYAGYSYVILGEQFCGSPINVSRIHTSDELFAMGVERFDDAIRIATAAKAAGAKAVSADSIINLARVGAARAALGLGQMEKAIGYAAPVPADFVFWVAHSPNTGRETNDFWGPTAGGDLSSTANGTRWIGLEPGFEGLDDRRMPTSAQRVPIMDQRTVFVPFQSSAFNGWNPSGDPVAFQKNTYTRLASGLEARYILAEAGGMNDAQLLAFINERRSVGGQGLFAGNTLQEELREQRRRDFFMDGHRLGDMRRYKKAYGIDLFAAQGSAYPQTTDVYGTSECFPIPNSELNSNPNT